MITVNNTLMKKILFILVISIVFAACGSKQDNKQEALQKLLQQRDELNKQITQLEKELVKSDSSVSSKLVELNAITFSSFKNYVDVYGKVDADENIYLGSEMGGAITKILVKPGDEIAKGQLLAETDNKVLLQGIAELQNALDLATNLFNKQKNLWEQKIGTELQYLTAKNQKESLEKKMQTLQQQLEMTKIKSPINGTVDAVDSKIGQMAIPGMPFIRVVNFENLKIKAEVPENYAGKVKKGDSVLIILPDLKDTIQTKINFVAKVINTLNRTFTIEVGLNKKEYHPNMIAVVKIISYNKPSALSVPVALVQQSNNEKYIMIAENGKAAKRLVKTGQSYNGIIEVVEGLKEGELIITKGYQDLNNGDAVKN